MQEYGTNVSKNISKIDHFLSLKSYEKKVCSPRNTI